MSDEESILLPFQPALVAWEQNYSSASAHFEADVILRLHVLLKLDRLLLHECQSRFLRRLQITRYSGNGIDFSVLAVEGQFAVWAAQVERLGPLVDFVDFLFELVFLVADLEVVLGLSRLICFIDNLM